jgi:hypothetical protein
LKPIDIYLKKRKKNQNNFLFKIKQKKCFEMNETSKLTDPKLKIEAGTYLKKRKKIRIIYFFLKKKKNKKMF